MRLLAAFTLGAALGIYAYARYLDGDVGAMQRRLGMGA